MKYKAVFFDFDGVILDSVDVKTEAFRAMYAAHGEEVAQAVVKHHLANGGMSRFDKFKYYHKTYLNTDINTLELEELCAKFKILVLEKVITAPYIDGVLNFLKQLNAENVACYIVSGTPDDEIKEIVRRKNLDSYFVEVHGSPKSKLSIVEDILMRTKHAPETCLFAGDAMSDYATAAHHSMDFLGVLSNGEKSFFPEDTITISNFAEFKVCHNEEN